MPPKVARKAHKAESGDSDSSIASSASSKRPHSGGDNAKESAFACTKRTKSRTEQGVTLEMLYEGITGIRGVVDRHSTILERHSTTLDQHGATLAHHSENTLPALTSKLEATSTDVTALKASNTTLEVENKVIRSTLLEMEGKVADLASKISMLSTTAATTTPTGDTSSIPLLVAASQAQTACLQRFLHSHPTTKELVISGLPVTDAFEDPLPLVNELLRVLNVILAPTDTLEARLLKKRPARLGVAVSHDPSPSASTMEALPIRLSRDKHEVERVSIAVKCSCEAFVSDVISAKRRLGLLKLSALNTSTFGVNAQTAPSTLDSIININELLPFYTFKLLGKAKAVLKANGFKYVWAKTTVVLAKHSDGGLAHIINSKQDIDNLARLYPASTKM